MKFKKKPVIIDAWKFDISNVDAVIAMYERIFNIKVKSMLDISILMQSITNTKGIPLPTDKGILFIYDGDWLIKEDGKFSTCTSDKFEELYEVIDGIS